MMNSLSRSTGLKIAAVIMWVFTVISMFAITIPLLTSGTTPASVGDPPFWLTALTFAIDAVAIVAAYGVWRAERWGIILAIIIGVYSALLNTMGALFDPNIRLMAVFLIFVSLVLIYLCLRRGPQGQTTAVQG